MAPGARAAALAARLGARLLSDASTKFGRANRLARACKRAWPTQAVRGGASQRYVYRVEWSRCWAADLQVGSFLWRRTAAGRARTAARVAPSAPGRRRRVQVRHLPPAQALAIDPSQSHALETRTPAHSTAPHRFLDWRQGARPRLIRGARRHKNHDIHLRPARNRLHSQRWAAQSHRARDSAPFLA